MIHVGDIGDLTQRLNRCAGLIEQADGLLITAVGARLKLPSGAR